jgi:hypothetical protein
LAKNTQTAHADARMLTLGVELRMVVDGQLLWSQVFMPEERPTLQEAAEFHRQEYKARGGQ